MNIILITDATNSDADTDVYHSCPDDDSGFQTASDSFSDDEEPSPLSASDLGKPIAMKPKKGEKSADGKKKSANKKSADGKKKSGNKKSTGNKKRVAKNH